MIGHGRKPFGIVFVVLLISIPVFGELGGSQKYEEIAKSVAIMMQSVHVRTPYLNDAVSEKFFQKFIEGFDPTKIYFLQTDMEEFSRKKTELDDDIQAGDLSFADLVLARYRQRISERFAMVHSALELTHDFAAEETLNTDYKHLDHPKDDAEAFERLRKLIKSELLGTRLDTPGLPFDKQKEKIIKKHQASLRYAAQISDEDLLENYLTALTSSFDPHSAYLSPMTYEDRMGDITLNLAGIGTMLKSEDGEIIVKEVLAGGAAALDGRIQSGDKIVGFAPDGDSSNVIEVLSVNFKTLVNRIRGPAGKMILLRVIPFGKTEPVDYVLMRRQIPMDAQRARGEVWDENRGEVPLRIGIIQLPSFYGGGNTSCTQDVNRILIGEAFRSVDGVVLDLRGNGGGLLREAVGIVGLFIEKGPVVQVRGPGGAETYNDEDPSSAYVGPLLVLVDRRTGSASEIVAGAIQDYGRGIIVGDSSTFGKGSVQTILEIARFLRLREEDKYGALKITTQEYYRISGEGVQAKGVIPDIILPSFTEVLAPRETDDPEALSFSKIGPENYHAVPQPLSEQQKRDINTFSQTRRRDSQEFGRLLVNLERLKTHKGNHSISLNETARLSDREVDKLYSEFWERLTDQNKDKRTMNHSHFYDREVFSIMADYLQMIEKPRVARGQ